MTAVPAMPSWFDLKDAESKLAAGWSPSTAWYHDTEIHRFELETIFRRSWQYGAPANRLQTPGDVVVTRVGEIPVVLTRSLEGRLHGFVNVCRHRGYAVATEDGSRRSLTCRYHAWSYGLDGQLKKAPGCKNEPGFDLGELSLIPVAVDSWGPIVFVNADATAMPLRAAHPNFERILARREFDPNPENYTFFKRYEYDVRSNWKLWYDNAVECYHCPTIHPGTFNGAYNTRLESVDAIQVDRLLSQRFSPSAGEGEDIMRSRNYRGLQMFPGFIFIQQDDLMIIAQMCPTGPETTRFISDVFGPTGSDLQRVAAWADLWDRTFKEDADAVAVQQAGLRHDRMPNSRFMGSNEKGLLFINRMVLEAFKDALRPHIQAPTE